MNVEILIAVKNTLASESRKEEGEKDAKNQPHNCTASHRVRRKESYTE